MNPGFLGFLALSVTLSAGLAIAGPFVATGALAAPVAAGQVDVIVQDALGRPLAGARVTLENAVGNTIAEGVTDAQGRYVFTAVPNGVYAVQATLTDYDPARAIATVTPGGAVQTRLSLAAREALSLQVRVERLNRARNTLSPSTGSSTYQIDRQAINQLPRGENTPVNQVLLQAPGVVQNTFGQINVRGDHGNLQYRINGVLLPEGITGFGSTLDTRFADRVTLLTGALPAQYGYRTAGVVDIATKTGATQPGGRLNVQAGTYGDFEPSLQYGGTTGPLDYYASGAYIQNALGIDPFTSTDPSLHNQTWQGKGFGYASSLLNDTTRLSLITGTSAQTFQVPNIPGETPEFMLANTAAPPSANLDAYLRPTNHYGVLALQGSPNEAFDYQLAGFGRYSSLQYQPDPIGDLVYTGLAADIFRSSLVGGFQGDAAYKLGAGHTLRLGTYGSAEGAISNNTSRVFPADGEGKQTSTTPLTITDNNAFNSFLYSVYAQDEWQLAPPLTLNYGLRFDMLEGFIRDNELSPRVGLVYQVTPATTLHAGYARYFTPPTTELITLTSIQKFQGTTNALPTDVNTQVKPERAHYYDVGVLHQVTPQLSFGLDGYYKDVADIQDVGQFGKALIFSAFNLNQGKIMGLEATGSYRAGDLNTYLNLTASRAQGQGISSGQYNLEPDELAYINSNWVTLDHSQALTASAGVSYPVFGTMLAANMLVGSSLPRGFANTENLPAYTQFNLDASRSFQFTGFGPLEARVSLINLLDTRYALRDGSGIGVGAPQFGPPRSLYLSLSKPF